MTIQENLKLQFRVSSIVAITSWLIGVIISVNNYDQFNLIKNICFIIFIVSVFYLQFFIACPKCDITLFSAKLKHSPFSIKTVPDKCLDCGCNFLEDVKIINSNNKMKDKNQ